MVSAPSLTYAGCLPGSMLDREPDTSSPRDVKYQQTRSASSTGYTDCADKDTAHPCRLGRALHTPYSYCTLRRLPAAPQQCAPAMLARQLIASICLEGDPSTEPCLSLLTPSRASWHRRAGHPAPNLYVPSPYTVLFSTPHAGTREAGWGQQQPWPHVARAPARTATRQGRRMWRRCSGWTPKACAVQTRAQNASWGILKVRSTLAAAAPVQGVSHVVSLACRSVWPLGRCRARHPTLSHQQRAGRDSLHSICGRRPRRPQSRAARRCRGGCRELLPPGSAARARPAHAPRRSPRGCSPQPRRPRTLPRTAGAHAARQPAAHTAAPGRSPRSPTATLRAGRPRSAAARA